MPTSRELEMPTYGGDNVARFEALASLWHDLMYVRQVLSERGRYPVNGETLFVRRALWEAAVIAYGRCFKKGRRQKLTREFFDDLEPDDLELHERMDDWRDEHVAHRADRARESVATAIVLRAKDRVLEPRGVRTYVTTTLGPADESEVDALANLVGRLMDKVWKELHRLAEVILNETNVDAGRAGPPRDVSGQPLNEIVVKIDALFATKPA